jgi:DNA end-binding protein Ku
VLDLIERKAGGEEFELPEVAREAPKVVDLMAALEASVKAAKDARSRHPAGGEVVAAKKKAAPGKAAAASKAPQSATAKAAPKQRKSA